MVKPDKREKSPEAPPANFPETTPQIYPSSDYSFTLQAIMEMQKTLGQLTQAVTTLTEESKERGKTLDTISHKVYAAQVVIGVAAAALALLGSAVVFILNRLCDTILPLLQIKPHP